MRMLERNWSQENGFAVAVALVPASLATISAILMYKGIADRSLSNTYIRGHVPLERGAAGLAWLFAGLAIATAVLQLRFWLLRQPSMALAATLASLLPYGLLIWSAESMNLAASECRRAAVCGDGAPYPVTAQDAIVAVLVLLLALVGLAFSMLAALQRLAATPHSYSGMRN